MDRIIMCISSDRISTSNIPLFNCTILGYTVFIVHMGPMGVCTVVPMDVPRDGDGDEQDIAADTANAIDEEIVHS